MSSDSNFKKMLPIVLTAFMGPFTGSAINLSIPAMSAEFSAGAVSVGWIITIYLLSSTVLTLPFGRMADLFGKKPLFVLGTIVFSVGSLLCCFAWNIQSILLFRLLQGSGAALLFATNSALVAALFPPQIRGRMMGLSVSFTYLGLSLGPVVGGILNHNFGWRSVFLFITIYSIPAIVTAITMIHEPKAAEASLQKDRQRMDASGSILYGVSLALILYGLTTFTSASLSKALLAAGVILLAVFFFHEKQTASPILDVSMLTRNRTFALSNLAALLNYGASYSVSYMISIYLQNVKGFDSQLSGIILIVGPALQTIVSPIAGRMSDRRPPHLLASAGMALTGAGILMLIFLKEGTGLPYLMTALAIIGVGFGFFSSPNSNAIMSSADKRQYGVASSIMSTSRTIGQTTSMAVVTAVTGAVIGNITLEQAAASSIVAAVRAAFIISTVFCIVGVFCSLGRSTPQQSE